AGGRHPGSRPGWRPATAMRRPARHRYGPSRVRLALLAADVGGLDDPLPASEVLAEPVAELPWSEAGVYRAELAKLLRGLGLRERFPDRLVELCHDGRRRAGRREQAHAGRVLVEPLEARLVGGGQVREIDRKSVV